MKALLDNIIPFICLMAAAVICIVAEYLLKKGVFKLPEKTAKILKDTAVLMTVLVGSGMIVFLTVIGAGVEVMLPVVLLILFGTLI